MGSCTPVSIRILTVSVLLRCLFSLTNKSLFHFSSPSISGLNSSGTFTCSNSSVEIRFFCLSGIVISVLNLVIRHSRFKVTVWLDLFIMSNGNLRDLLDSHYNISH